MINHRKATSGNLEQDKLKLYAVPDFQEQKLSERADLDLASANLRVQISTVCIVDGELKSVEALCKLLSGRCNKAAATVVALRQTVQAAREISSWVVVGHNSSVLIADNKMNAETLC